MVITYSGPSTSQVTRDVQDSILLRTQTPLIAFDDLGRPVRNDHGQLVSRKASRNAIELAGCHLVDVGEYYLRQVGTESVRAYLAKLGKPKLAQLLMSRYELSRYFRDINPQARGISLASSTGDYPELLADTANKAVLTHYAKGRRSWRAWAKRGTVKNFETADRMRVEDAALPETLLPGQQINFSHLPESPRETFALATYARGLKFTRRALLNDDAEGLRGLFEILAQGCYRLEDSLAYAVLTANANMADGNALFSASHNNLATGQLTVSNIGAAATLIAQRTNTAGDVLDHQAARLIVPSTLAPVAAAVLDSLSRAPRGDTEAILTLTSTAHLDANSSSEWYLSTDPAVMAPVEVSFLEGNEHPTIADKTEFESDSVMFKCRHDVKATAIDYRAIVRSSGV